MQEIKLSDWARANNKTYKEAWKLVQSDEFPGKTRRTRSGRIMVIAEASQSPPKFGIPIMTNDGNAEVAIASTSRRNRAATIEPTDQYYHIQNGVHPFEQKSDGNISIKDAIELCQKAYWNFSIFKNTIDVMTEFSTSNIYLRGGSQKSKDFFYAWLNKLNINEFQGKFFREYYRSGNVICYRYDVKIKESDIEIINQNFGTAIAKELSLPCKYIILNPADIIIAGNISFASANFYKRLTPYEIQRLKNPQTQDEKDLFSSLPPDAQNQIKNSKGGEVSIDIPLSPDKVYAVFYKKQDYEPLAIPMGYPVLKDINWKAEMKAIDMAVSRTLQRSILLIKMGYESKAGEYIFDQNAANVMRQLFENESVGKTLVADFTTDVKFIIPDIGNLLNPEKYQVINEDIRTGLNNILMGQDEKFANRFIAVQLFVQRLKESREIFLNSFLIPEIKRLASQLGFKNYPTPFFEDIDLKDDAEFNRIVTRLAELGILTPWETLNGIETGRLPTKEESLLSQEELRQLKDEGFYEPIAGGPYTQEKLAELRATTSPSGISNPGGRPPGSTRKQSTKKITPMGASYSLSKLKDNIILASNLRKEIESTLLKKHKLKKLNDEQNNIVDEFVELIICNETPDNWIKAVSRYLDNPVQPENSVRLKEINDIAYKHQINNYLAGLLLASKID